jgi:hypothetical protein
VTSSLAVVHGRSAILLVAPHAGRRDAARRPWGSAPLKMNDLHTGAVARALAARLEASALLNENGDRNDVDLNRLSAAHDRAPWFLDALADLIEDTLARHERVQLLTVHGWNVVQPAVDIGLGVRPCAAALAGDDGAAVSAAFAGGVLPRLASRLAASGIAATPGLRYPARGRENLLQLFTGRYAGDPRGTVRRLARLAARVDAVQLELSLSLRLAGGWREAFLDACADALGTGDVGAGAGWPPWEHTPVGIPERASLEFVAPGMSGLAAIDEHGGRLLLFLDDGRLVTFTGERVGVHERARIAGLRLTTTERGDVELDYAGPMLIFPDTSPFVDLESGLARATAVAAEVTLRLVPTHRDASGPCPSGLVTGAARIAGTRYDVTGHGVRALHDATAGAVRASLRLPGGTVLVAHGSRGFVCRDGQHHALRRCAVRRAGDHAHVGFEAADGVVEEAVAAVRHRLRVVPGTPGAAHREFVACTLGEALAGWLELRSA